MSQIHFIGGEKGGIGKSLLARVLAQHFIDVGLGESTFAAESLDDPLEPVTQ